MNTWDKILCLKIKLCKPRFVSRFVKDRKCLNEAEKRLNPIAFYRGELDKKEMSVYCLDSYIKTNRQHKKIWKIGDNIYKKIKKIAIARGEVKVDTINAICCDKDKMLNLFLVPPLFGKHYNIKPMLDDFHADDVRVAKLADNSHLVKRV